MPYNREHWQKKNAHALEGKAKYSAAGVQKLNSGVTAST